MFFLETRSFLVHGHNGGEGWARFFDGQCYHHGTCTSEKSCEFSLGMIPSGVFPPIMVCVFPLPVWPYANIVAKRRNKNENGTGDHVE